MVALMIDKQADLKGVCERFGVARLELFGSAATESDFDPDHSDLDFLVEFRPGQELGPWLSHFFAFQGALEELFGRSVDLVMPSAVKNERFLREMNRTRRPVYAA